MPTKDRDLLSLAGMFLSLSALEDHINSLEKNQRKNHLKHFLSRLLPPDFTNPDGDDNEVVVKVLFPDF